jgi:hypothetical protein
MGANLELWTYRLFKNDCLYLEEVLQKSYAASTDNSVDHGFGYRIELRLSALLHRLGLYPLNPDLRRLLACDREHSDLSGFQRRLIAVKRMAVHRHAGGRILDVQLQNSGFWSLQRKM